ncbi:MAG: hypothetical protein E6Q76_05335 [Rhizobium sp.]|nr:MAG: hypothetical protein E6Q76_05335 [Rhizobium sp.]
MDDLATNAPEQSATDILMMAEAHDFCRLVTTPDLRTEPHYVLVGWGHSLMTSMGLAKIDSVDLSTFKGESGLTHRLGPCSFKTIEDTPQIVHIDWQGTALMRFKMAHHHLFPVMFLVRDVSFLSLVHQHILKASFQAARKNHWLLLNASVWAQAELEASSQKLRPDVGFNISHKFAWRLARPIFRAGVTEALLEWHLAFANRTNEDDIVATVVTDQVGKIQRQADKLLMRSLQSSITGNTAPPTVSVLTPELHSHPAVIYRPADPALKASSDVSPNAGLSPQPASPEGGSPKVVSIRRA